MTNATTFAPLARLPLSVDGALHVKLYRHASSARLCALVTTGLTHNTTARRRVVAIDVTDPRRPVEVASVAAWAAGCSEGVFVVDDVAFIGSAARTTRRSRCVTLSGRLSVLNASSDVAYENMVSAEYTLVSLDGDGGDRAARRRRGRAVPPRRSGASYSRRRTPRRAAS